MQQCSRLTLNCKPGIITEINLARTNKELLRNIDDTVDVLKQKKKKNRGKELIETHTRVTKWRTNKNLNESLEFKLCYSTSRHCMKIAAKVIAESNDVETNPGPEPLRNEAGASGSIEVISYNVRGLNDQKKFRHLINLCYKKGPSKNKDQIFCFQETFIEKAGILPFLWRGNFHLTPGRGNSSGCLTLLSHHINILYTKDFENRAHVLVCQKSDDLAASFVVANIYAPNANNNLKVNFFEEIFNEIAEVSARFDCERTIVMGDFNVIFKQSESKNRAYSSQEKMVARAIKPILDDLNLTDIGLKDFTWCRPNSEIYSSIDRMFYNKTMLTLKSVKTNWSISMSDHAAIEAYFDLPNKMRINRARIPRLDPS